MSGYDAARAFVHDTAGLLANRLGLLWLAGLALLAVSAGGLLLLGMSRGNDEVALGSIPTDGLTLTNHTTEPLVAQLRFGTGAAHRLEPGETRTVTWVLPRHPAEADSRYDDIDDPMFITFRDASGCVAFVFARSVRDIQDELNSHVSVRPKDLMPEEQRRGCRAR